MQLFKRGENIYTGNDKVQAMDGLGHFLSNSNSIYKELVRPILSGEVDREKHIKDVTKQLIYNMKYEANTNDGKIKVPGKSKYYPIGKWSKQTNGRGETFEMLELDILGKDKDIFNKDYLEKRVENFLNMGHEINLLDNLKKLDVDVRGSSEFEDKVKKVDLVIRGKHGIKVGVSVFKSPLGVALDKLRASNRADFEKRLAYNVYKYGNPSDIENVKKWMDDCNKGINEIIIEADGRAYVIKESVK